jgi:hypothetical protein
MTKKVAAQEVKESVSVGAHCDWVIIGVRGNDGVVVFASDTLTEAELATETERVEYYGSFDSRIINSYHTFRGEMRSYVTATGPNYGVALANLFGAWQPAEPVGIEEARR